MRLCISKLCTAHHCHHNFHPKIACNSSVCPDDTATGISYRITATASCRRFHVIGVIEMIAQLSSKKAPGTNCSRAGLCLLDSRCRDTTLSITTIQKVSIWADPLGSLPPCAQARCSESTEGQGEVELVLVGALARLSFLLRAASPAPSASACVATIVSPRCHSVGALGLVAVVDRLSC